MNDRNMLVAAGLPASFFNVLAQAPYQQLGDQSRRYDLDNGPFMRDTAIVTAAFGNIAQLDERGRVTRIELPVKDTPYVCVLSPQMHFAMGIIHHIWTYGYEIQAHIDEQMAVKGRFHLSTYKKPAVDGQLAIARAQASFEIAESEGNGAGLNHLYRQIVKDLPEARRQLKLSV